MLTDGEPDVTSLGHTAVAERWREVLRLGSTAEMRESKTAHLLASLAREGKTSSAPAGMNPRRWRPGTNPYLEMRVECFENGRVRMHPLEGLLFNSRSSG